MSTSKYIETGALDQSQLATVARLIQAIAPGVYTLRELFGEEEWGLVTRKRAYGQWFRRSVDRSEIPGVRWAGRRSNRSQTYIVSAVLASGDRSDEAGPS